MDKLSYDELYEQRFADLQNRLHAENLLEIADKDFVIRKRGAIASALEAYTKLSEAGKAEFIRQLNALNGSDYAKRRAALDKMHETLNEMRLRTQKHFDCPCCGYRSVIED